MPEPDRYVFSYKEIAELLVKHAGIHEGTWGVYVEFGITAANIGGGPDDLMPAAIVPVIKLGIHKCKEASALTVEAAEVNPKSVRSKKHGQIGKG